MTEDPPSKEKYIVTAIFMELQPGVRGAAGWGAWGCRLGCVGLQARSLARARGPTLHTCQCEEGDEDGSGGDVQELEEVLA